MVMKCPLVVMMDESMKFGGISSTISLLYRLSLSSYTLS